MARRLSLQAAKSLVARAAEAGASSSTPTVESLVLRKCSAIRNTDGMLFMHPRAQMRCFASSTSTPAVSRGSPVSYISLGLTMATGVGVIWYYNYVKEHKLEKIRSQNVSVGTSAIGGPFQLVDHNGQAFTDDNLKGKWSMLYFGFTFCPDICPDELEKLIEAIQHIEKSTKTDIQPIFISVDPERDTVKQIATYVKEFHPRLIGLTGPIDKVKEAAKAYRVYYSKTDDGPDYLVDHSIIMYLINPEGQFVTFYGKNYTPKDMADSVSEHITSYKPGKR